MSTYVVGSHEKPNYLLAVALAGTVNLHKNFTDDSASAGHKHGGRSRRDQKFAAHVSAAEMAARRET
jgi:hypothetical protein